ncbi:hypothetical protein GS584_21910 [Rhodococcus hoagii]|nr:hypothetical protein [Prescottella equi]
MEGDSAGGSAKSARDSMYQAILPLRARSSTSRRPASTASQERRGPVDHHRVRHRHPRRVRHQQAALPQIVLMADADVDGQHIATLLLTAAVPVHASARRAGSRVPGAARRSTSSSGRRARPPTSRTPTVSVTVCSRPSGRGQEDQQGRRHPALQGSGRDERQGTVGDHHGPSVRVLRQVTLDDAAAADERSAAHGRGRRGAPQLHHPQRQGRPLPRACRHLRRLCAFPWGGDYRKGARAAERPNTFHQKVSS